MARGKQPRYHRIGYFPDWMKKMARGKCHSGKMLMRHGANSSFPLFGALKGRKGMKAKMTRAGVGGGRGVTMTRVCQECLWRTCCAAGKPMDQVPPCQLPCSSVPKSNCAILREGAMREIESEAAKNTLRL